VFVAALVSLITALASAAAAGAAQPIHPLAWVHADRLAPEEAVPLLTVPPVDRAAAALEDIARGEAGLPPRFAIPTSVTVTPETSGSWDAAPDGSLVWRLRVRSPAASSLNLGFTQYGMPPGGALYVYSPDRGQWLRPFTDADNTSHGELWTPVLLADALVVEVDLPAGTRDALQLHLGQVNAGYRYFGAKTTSAPESGSCNVDVVCPDGDPWRNEIPAIARISISGIYLCTGFMVNNTARDQRPLFQTANHCGLNSGNSGTLVAYWNYQTSVCGGTPDGSLADNQSGSTWRAAYSPSDFTLVELSRSPDPAWKISFAGWDNTGADAANATCIHHPNADEKRISFEYQATSTTSYLGNTSPGDGTHVRVFDWDKGTTEGGSSGSPLFDQNHHVIGQLHGGYAACGNDLSDWFGKFAVSWNGGGTSSSRLRDWLDPGNTGATSLDTLNPYGTSCQTNADCDDGLFCNGAETCVAGSCQAGGNPCPGQGCDEATNTCVPLTCNGNGTCETGETCNNCASDCPSGTIGACGNHVCETGAGEDCLSCPSDCNGVQGGKPAGRYCCGDGAGVNPIGCGDARCNVAGNSCSAGGGQ